MEIDTAMAARFLAALSADSSHTFQTFSEVDGGGRSLNRILHGTFEHHAVSLQSLSLKGAGAFVMVNRGDGRGRKSENVTAVRSLFVDLDGAPVDPVLTGPLPPRIVVESSPGKWHCYWPVVDMPLECFRRAQKALAQRFGGDTAVCDWPRVMRLPGFLHHKGAPFQTRLVSCDEAPLTYRELVEAFGLSDRMRLPDNIPAGNRNNTLYALARSAARKGVPEPDQLAKAHKVNGQRCQPPLDAAEVVQIVTSAYSRPAHGATCVPNVVLDSDAYMALGIGARNLLTMAYRKVDAYNRVFPLLWSELRRWFPQEKTFKRYRKELASSPLLTVALAPEPAMPRLGRGPVPTFYRLAIGDNIAPYSIASNGDKTAPPEALQAPSSEALPYAAPVDGIHGSERCAA